MLSHNKSPLSVLTFLKNRKGHKITRRTFTKVAEAVGHSAVRGWLDTLLHRGLIEEERFDRTVGFKLTPRGEEVPGPVDLSKLSYSAQLLLCAIGLHSPKSWTFLDYCAEADKATFGVIRDRRGTVMSTTVKAALTELRNADLVGTLDTLSLTLSGESAYLMCLTNPDLSNFFGARPVKKKAIANVAVNKPTGPVPTFTPTVAAPAVIAPVRAKSQHVLIDFSVKLRLTRTRDSLFVATCGEDDQGGVVLGEIRGLALPSKPLTWTNFEGGTGESMSETAAFAELVRDLTKGMLTPALAQGIHGVTHVTV